MAGHDVVHAPQLARRSIGLAGQYAAVDENLTGRENLILVGRLNHLARADVLVRSTQFISIAWSLGISVVLAPIAVHRYRRV